MPSELKNTKQANAAKVEIIAKAQNLAIQYFRSGNMKDALVEARKAADIDYTNTKLQNLAGAIASELKTASTAIMYLRASLLIDPDQVDANFLLGNALLSENLYNDALASFEKTLLLDPKHSNASYNKGLAHNKLNSYSNAERAFRYTIELDPNHAEAHHTLSQILSSKTQYDKAEMSAKNAIALDEENIQYVITLAGIYRNVKRFAEAEDIFRTALHLHPYNPKLLTELGVVLRVQNKFDEAQKIYEEALELRPYDKNILLSAASYYQSSKKHEEAYETYLRYIDVNPKDTSAYNNIAIVLRDLERFSEAEKYYLKCAETDPRPAYAYNNLAILAMEMGNPETSIEYYRKALAKEPIYATARSNMLFYMNYLDDAPAHDIYKEHLEWKVRHTEPLMDGTCVHPNDPSPKRKLRIGYVSADFYGHAVSYFIEPALKNHDKDKFEIFCYAHVATPDGMTKKFQGYADHWLFITQLTDDEVIAAIKKDKIDILIDLGGHTAGHRLSVFARKPAPVQVTWIGYPNTTGLDTIDYRFVDNITDPVGLADEIHSEKLWRLPDVFTCYNPQTTLPPATSLAAKDTGQITFGSFNNATKMSLATIKAWAKILNRVKGSRLILKTASLADEETKERFLSQFQEAGGDLKRIEMFGRMTSNEHMRFYDSIDIALDTFPYNGTTTSCEALWMGVPIICMHGDRHAACVTASLSTQMGLGDLAGNDEDGYVENAVALANDLDRLEDIRLNLRERMRLSPLCNQEQHTKSVENAYHEMWDIWCKEEKTRRKERKKIGRPETTPYLPTMRLIHSLGSPTATQFKQCIGVMKDVYLSIDSHPLGMVVFPMMKIMQDFYNFYDTAEFEKINDKGLSFIETSMRLHEEIQKRNGTLVVAEWSHLDYIALPFLPTPSYENMTTQSLEKSFSVKEVFLFLHPSLQWDIYCVESNMDKNMSVEEFLKGYRKMVELGTTKTFYRYEDFAENPEATLRSVCENLDIEFDENFASDWPFYTNILGLASTKTLEQKAEEKINVRPLLKLDSVIINRMKSNEDYQEIIKLLKYNE